MGVIVGTDSGDGANVGVGGASGGGGVGGDGGRSGGGGSGEWWAGEKGVLILVLVLVGVLVLVVCWWWCLWRWGQQCSQIDQSARKKTDEKGVYNRMRMLPVYLGVLSCPHKDQKNKNDVPATVSRILCTTTVLLQVGGQR